MFDMQIVLDKQNKTEQNKKALSQMLAYLRNFTKQKVHFLSVTYIVYFWTYFSLNVKEG